MNRTQWLAAVYEELGMRYGLDVEALGWDEVECDRFYGYGELPTEFVSWYAEKYDLMAMEALALR